MVSTITSYTDSRYRAYTGEGLDGVVRVSVGGFYGTGVLLYDGQAVLTAAHLLVNNTTASVFFETSAGEQTITSNRLTVHPYYDDIQSNNDLAIVWLSSPAPVTAERYTLYRASDEFFKTLTIVGYGLPGTGATGEVTDYSGSPIRLKANNQFEADAATLKYALGSGMGWTPTAGTQLVADFDNGTASQDALGQLLGLKGTGLGQNEGLIAPGDSGGPAFINGQVAGIASYIASLENGSSHPDIDNVTNSSFGEIGAWQRVSYYQQWIDQSVRDHYPNAPTQPSQVQKSLIEGDSGTTYAYFLLQFTGMRSDPNQRLSVDYSTRDGSAQAGQDYLAVSGTLVLYPGENEAVIPVEIRGDTLPESNENFYLDITNPVGGSFGVGVLTLTAMRTIVNDDGSLLI